MAQGDRVSFILIHDNNFTFRMRTERKGSDSDALAVSQARSNYWHLV
jgi:hypothetical protein